MAHDVFICYASEDKVTANAACARLEAAGIRCWIAPRDPIAGIPYGRQLIDAITNTRVVLLVFSGNANHSEHVLRELEVASDANKVIVPFRIEEVAPSGDLRYYITRVHWLDALTPPLEHRLDELLTLIQRLLEIPTTELLEMPGRKMPPSPAQRAAKRKSASPLMTGLVGALSAVVVIGLIAALASAMHPPGTAPRVAALPTRHKSSGLHDTHKATRRPKPSPKPASTTNPYPAVAAAFLTLSRNEANDMIRNRDYSVNSVDVTGCTLAITNNRSPSYTHLIPLQSVDIYRITWWYPEGNGYDIAIAPLNDSPEDDEAAAYLWYSDYATRAQAISLLGSMFTYCAGRAMISRVVNQPEEPEIAPYPIRLATPIPMPPTPPNVACAAPVTGTCEAARMDEGVTGAQDFREGEYATALRFFRDAAGAGSADSETWIGYMYESGLGEPQSYAQALYWYQRAVADGASGDYASNAVNRVQQALNK